MLAAARDQELPFRQSGVGSLKVASPRGGVGAVVREGKGSVGGPMEMLLERESVLGQLGVLGQRAGRGAGRGGGGVAAWGGRGRQERGDPPLHRRPGRAGAGAARLL